MLADGAIDIDDDIEAVPEPAYCELPSAYFFTGAVTVLVVPLEKVSVTVTSEPTAMGCLRPISMMWSPPA